MLNAALTFDRMKTPAREFHYEKKAQPPLQPLQANLLKTKPPAPQGILRFVVVGDIGGGPNEKQYAIARQLEELYAKKPFSAVLVLGDNVYEEGDPALFEERIRAPFQALLDKGVRFYPILGNHDVHKGHGPEQVKYWGLPRSFYNVSLGDVDLFALDTTVMLPGFENCYNNQSALADRLAKTQAAWLEHALKMSKARFKVVYGHYPMQMSSPDATRQLEARLMTQKLKPVLAKNQVDFYLAGHEHLYERFLDDSGMQMITSGGASRLSHLGPHTVPPNRVCHKSDNHFMLFELENNRLAFQAINAQGAVIDAGNVEKPAKLDLIA